MEYNVRVINGMKQHAVEKGDKDGQGWESC